MLQRLELFGVQQQRFQTTRHHVAGGLVAADEDQHRLVDQILGRHGLTLGEHQQADEILSLRIGAGAHLPDDVLDPLDHGADHLLGKGFVGGTGGEEIGPVQELVLVGKGQPHEGGDHPQRNRCGDVVDEVAGTAIDHVVDQLGDGRTEELLVTGDPPWREARRDESTTTGVFGRVVVDHRRQRDLGARTLGRAEGLVVGLDALDVLVAGDRPEAGRVVPVDRRVRPHPGHPFERIGVEIERHDDDVVAGRVLRRAVDDRLGIKPIRVERVVAHDISYGRGSRGRPRTRSPRMLRMMSLVPPMIVYAGP